MSETNIDKSISEEMSVTVDAEQANQPSSTEVSSFDIHASRVPSTPAESAPVSHSASDEPPSRASESDDHRVLCANCDEWIVTKDADGKENNNLAEHSAQCTTQSAPRTGNATPPSVTDDGIHSISAASTPPRDSNTAFRRRKVKHYESERLALLQRDPQIDRVEPYRVLCTHCEKWVHLRKDRPYCPIAWTAHKLQCVNHRKKAGPSAKKVKREQHSASVSSTVPPPEPLSSPTGQIRRTEEERIQFLVSDPYATNVEAHRILCGICRRWIQLRKNSTYCTAPWVQHVRKCAVRHNVPRGANGSSTGAYDDAEDDVESEDAPPPPPPPPRVVQQISETPPLKRGRGRPRKRKLGEPKPATQQPSALFVLRPSRSPPRQRRRASASPPPPPRTPSPPLAHPYSNDAYWYPALPPMSSYYPLYAGSQYNEHDASYSLYFHAQPPAHQVGPTPGQGRFRAGKPSKQTLLAPGPPAGPPAGPPSMPPPPASPGPNGRFSPPPGRAWIVWRLKDYSTNSCPMDPAPPHPPAPLSETSGSNSGSGEGSLDAPGLPMFRSGTWPHLLDPQDSQGHQQNLAPYVHPDVKENGSASGRLGPPPPLPSPEDPALISFNSSAHIPIRASDPYLAKPPPPPSLPDPNIDPRFTMPPPQSPSPGLAMPVPPTGADLDSPECRLAYTFQAIAYLFRTSFQGADDMSLDVLTAFMNRLIPADKAYDGHEVGQHVAILGERKQLVFTKEGGVQLAMSSPA